MRIGFIGLGNMACAMIGGILGEKAGQADEIAGTDVLESAKEAACGQFGIRILSNAKETAKWAELLILAVKPQYYEEVIDEIRDAVTEEHLLLTIAPGKTLGWMEEKLGRPAAIVRCMPNTPALVKEGCSAVCANRLVTKDQLQHVLFILRSFGMAELVDEKLMDAVAGVSGSSPAYVFIFLEALADAGVRAGMSRKMAYQFAAQAVKGSAQMLLETGKHPGELKDMVCSPGGTTIEAVKVLEEEGMRSAVFKAVEACIEKAKIM